MRVSYEIENGKKVKVETYADGSVKKYDENGNEIYYKDSDGKENWGEYDSNGNLIYHKLDSGFQIWYEYDSNGNMIHKRESSRWQEWYEYDANGKMIHSKDCMGHKWFARDYEARKVC